MLETTQSLGDYENSSELDIDLSKENWQKLANNATFEETASNFDNIKKQKLLSKSDFKKYFEWENFKQRNVGDCRLLAAIDSLVSFWDYENLIRTSVIKDSKWYTFYLPLWAPHIPWHEFCVTYEELNTNQVGIDWKKPILVTWKQWIQALVQAYWKMSTWKDGQFDYNNLRGWKNDRTFNDLVYGINSYRVQRIPFRSAIDPDWTIDKQFTNKFYKTLENFDKNDDMLTLSVHQLKESDLDRQNIEWEAYSSLWHYSKTNHEISVERVRKEKWTLIVTVSNPRDSYKTYDKKFEDLIKSCSGFHLWSKKKRERLKQSNKTYEGERAHTAADRVNEIWDIHSVNQVVQVTWWANEALREARWDILVTENGNNTFKVSSYNLEMNIKERGWEIIIYNNGTELSINKTKLSNKYKYDGKTVENDQYPLLLYWAKIANFINMMRKFYINPKKRDKSNNKPFRIIDWSLQFDDDPSTFEWRDKVRREWAERFWDDYIECLNDWNSLWISNNDKNTQQKIADLLNQLVKYRKMTY